MPGSQLKRLKASLREQGVIGPQQSKKQRRKVAQNGKVNTNKRAAALESLREEFNPFDLKHNARGPKFPVTSNRRVVGDAAKGIAGRPGDAKAIGEERRRQTLLVEMNRRNKTGGIRDQRFGEDDASMTYEEKMAQRFMKEKQSHHKTSLFDLEEDEPIDGLTHMGKSIAFPEKDDFEETDLLDPEDGDSSEDSIDNLRGLKRVRESDDVEDPGHENVDEEPERKKSKQEIYKEIMAKSKLHKAERQAQKDEDEDLREELDEELSDIQALLFRKQPQKTESDEATLRPGNSSRERMERDYDLRLRQLAMDGRAKPSDRTLTEEEIAQRDVERLKELEDKRQKRMRGEDFSDSEDGDKEKDARDAQSAADKPLWFDEEEEEDFKLGPGIRTRPTATELGFDDEDDFIVEDDLLASGSDLEPIESEDEDSLAEEEDDQEDEFTKGLLNEMEARDLAFANETDITKNEMSEINGCPETLEQLLDISRSLSPEQIPVLVQKVRILYHPKLASENKSKLADFSRVLVQYLFHQSNTPSTPPFTALESIIRPSLAPVKPTKKRVNFPQHEPVSGMRITGASKIEVKKLKVTDCVTPPSLEKEDLSTRIATLDTTLHLLDIASQLYASKASFNETFEPVLLSLRHLAKSSCRSQLPMALVDHIVKLQTKLQTLLTMAKLARRPLELHHHRPLAIKTAIPKFEDLFDPGKHYDADRDRAELAKLKAEHKKERKGAVREIRKDANFMAREKLRAKKQKDAAYEKKYKRLVAEIQGEEGHEANAYDRERQARKRASKRQG
ncbi:hypothetical protein E0Z10_g10612 [Xylaria hypoxylon]|uniref:Nop14-like family protein n=1 Tax=Xylaria hypoxylon TaxID=37992 RepID=A0A4Z0Y5M3_9PEZI|nr:hypothetical protein E0Z10_g10612 [Xylaria hypoxylon]